MALKRKKLHEHQLKTGIAAREALTALLNAESDDRLGPDDVLAVSEQGTAMVMAAHMTPTDVPANAPAQVDLEAEIHALSVDVGAAATSHADAALEAELAALLADADEICTTMGVAGAAEM